MIPPPLDIILLLMKREKDTALWLKAMTPVRPTDLLLQGDTVQDQHQPIIIPDTPSPPVSVITIRSDTDEEEDNKYKPNR